MGEAEALNFNFGPQSCSLASACLNAMNPNEIDSSKLSETLEMIIHCASAEIPLNETLKILRNLTATYRRLRPNQTHEKVQLREAILLLYKTHQQQYSKEGDLAAWCCDFMTVIATEYRDAEVVDAFAYADFLQQMFPSIEFNAKAQVKVTPKFALAIRAKTCLLLRAKLTVKHRCILLRLVCTLCDTYSSELLVSRVRTAGKSVNFDFSDLHLVTRLLSIEVSLIADLCLARLRQEREESAGAYELDESLCLLTLAYRFFETLLDLLRDESSEKAVELSADEKTQRNLRIVLTETLDVVQSLQADLLAHFSSSSNSSGKPELLHILAVCNSGLIMRWWTAETDVEPESASVVNDHKPLLLLTVQFAKSLLKGDSTQVQLHSLMSGLLALLSNVCMNDDLRTCLLQNQIDSLLIDYYKSKSGNLGEANLHSLASVLYVFIVLSSAAVSQLVHTAGDSFVRFVLDVMHSVAHGHGDTLPSILRVHAVTLSLLCATNSDFLSQLAASKDSDKDLITNVLLNGINYVASQRDEPAEDAGAQFRQVELCTLAISALCTFLQAHSASASASASATCNYAHELWHSLMHARGLEPSLHDFSVLMLNVDTKACSVPCIRSMQLRLLGTLQRCWHSVRDTAR